MAAEGAVLQLVAASHNEGTKSRSREKHLLVFFFYILLLLLFQSIGEILLGNLPVADPGYHLSFLSTTERLYRLQKERAGQTLKQSAALLAEQS